MLQTPLVEFRSEADLTAGQKALQDAQEALTAAQEADPQVEQDIDDAKFAVFEANQAISGIPPVFTPPSRPFRTER